MKNISMCMSIIMIHTGFLFAQDLGSKLPVPKSSDRKASEKEIQEIFEQEFSAAKTPEKKIALAKNLFQEGIDTRGDPSGRYVLFVIAKDLAVGAGDLDVAMRIIDRIGRFYQVDALKLKTETLTKLSLLKSVSTKEANKEISEIAFVTIDEAIASDRYDLISDLTKAAKAAARKVRDPAYIKQVVDRADALKSIEAEYTKAKDALKTLDTNPTDPQSNLIAGRFHSFIQGNWSKGLPMLVLGSDTTLKTLATTELKNPASSKMQMELADQWWDLILKQKGLAKDNLQAHAVSWYRKALPGLTGLRKVKVQKRLESVEKTQQPAFKKPTEPDLASKEETNAEKLAAAQKAAEALPKLVAAYKEQLEVVQRKQPYLARYQSKIIEYRKDIARARSSSSARYAQRYLQRYMGYYQEAAKDVQAAQYKMAVLKKQIVAGEKMIREAKKIKPK